MHILERLERQRGKSHASEIYSNFASSRVFWGECKRNFRCKLPVILWEVLKWVEGRRVCIEEMESYLVVCAILHYFHTSFSPFLSSCAFLLIFSLFIFYAHSPKTSTQPSFLSSTLELQALLISNQSHILQFHNHIFQKVQINLPVKSPSEEITRLKRKVR